MTYNNKIPTHDFLKGHDFTNNLKVIFGCKNLQELSEITGIPKSTFSTWNMKNRTSYELMIRIHLALNIPIRDLSLGYQFPTTDNGNRRVEEKSPEYTLDSTLTVEGQSRKPAIIETFDLFNGQLENRRAMLFDTDIITGYQNDKVIAVKEYSTISLIDTLCNIATSGSYLINIDGILSINQIQRIPSQQVAIAFNNSSLNVNEGDITLVGKVFTEVKNVTN
jgi:hypothetical protein